MPITDADLVFRQSERMTDFPDGGGRMSDVQVLDGVKNNLFPDITDIDRLTGRVSLRKVYAAALNADTDTLLSAHVLLDVPPVDAATSAVIFEYGGLGSTRADAMEALVLSNTLPLFAPYRVASFASDGQLMVFPHPSYRGGMVPVVGEILAIVPPSGSYTPDGVFRSKVMSVGALQTVLIYDGIPPEPDITVDYRALMMDPPIPFDLGEPFIHPGPRTYGDAVPGASLFRQRLFGVATSTAVADLGATSVTVASTKARISAPSEPELAAVVVNHTFVLQGDVLLIHHSASIGPASVSNGQTVDTLRTALARLRIIGNNGVEHYRATRGQAPVGAGATADLDAGTVTITDVAGFSQPVTIEHRIEELGLATTITLTTIGLNTGLTRAYPAGTRVSSLLMGGDLQGRALNGFAQTAWTGVWADTVIGGTPLGDYNEASYPITTTNAGAVTQRWAVIFTSTQNFRVVGEDLGEIGTGTTQAEYAPLNPATGQPFFRIPFSGWGSGWAAGNVYRFATIGSNTPVWALRCVAPSSPTGADSVTLQLRGYVQS